MLSILRRAWVGTKPKLGRWSCLAVAPSLTKCSGIFSFRCSHVAVVLYTAQSSQSAALLPLSETLMYTQSSR